MVLVVLVILIALFLVIYKIESMEKTKRAKIQLEMAIKQSPCTPNTHNYEACYDIKENLSNLPRNLSTILDVEKISNAFKLTEKTYRGHVCTKCGHKVNDEYIRVSDSTENSPTI